jgi:hypothetical protein
MHAGPKPETCHIDMLIPDLLRGNDGSQIFIQRPVHSLDKPITLWVIARRKYLLGAHNVANPQEYPIDTNFPRSDISFSGGPSHTRSSPNYKLLLEYNLILTQRLKDYPLALVGL